MDFHHKAPVKREEFPEYGVIMRKLMFYLYSMFTRNMLIKSILIPYKKRIDKSWS